MKESHFLKPLKRKSKHQHFGTFDIETTTDFRTFIYAAVFDGLSITYHDSVSSLVSKLLDYKLRHRIMYAHFGGKFDFQFLLSEIQKRGLLARYIEISGRLAQIKFRDKSGKTRLTLRDSYCLLPASLERLSEAFHVTHKKLAGAIDFEKECFDPCNEMHLKYLEHDVVSLYEVIEAHRKTPIICDIGQSLTAASTAMKAARFLLKDRIKVTPQAVQDFVRRSYAGGRTEIFKTEMNEGGACFDVNSLYPAMCKMPLPIERVSPSTDPSQFGFHDVTVRVPDCYLPILWTKNNEKRKLIFPTGTIRGVFFSEELKCAIQNGARVLKFHRGERFTQDSHVFSEFIDTFYQLRLQHPGTAIDYSAKIMLNSFYGKTGQRETVSSLTQVDPLDSKTYEKFFQPWRDEKIFKKFGLVIDTKFKRAPHMLVHIASAVTAYARIHMAENYYLPHSDSLHYTDTDSIFLSEEIATHPGLGGLKKEYELKYAFFLGPKGYYIEMSNGEIIKKLKGFNKKALRSVQLQDFKKGNISSKQTKFLTFRMALIQHNKYLGVSESIRSHKAVYDKRVILPSGDSRPWHLNTDGVLK